jgi:hypothetical protein
MGGISERVHGDWNPAGILPSDRGRLVRAALSRHGLEQAAWSRRAMTLKGGRTVSGYRESALCAFRNEICWFSRCSDERDWKRGNPIHQTAGQCGSSARQSQRWRCPADDNGVTDRLVADAPAGARVSQHVAIYWTKSTMPPIFLSFCLNLENYGQRQIGSARYGQTKSSLNFNPIRRFVIPVPAGSSPK